MIKLKSIPHIMSLHHTLDLNFHLNRRSLSVSRPSSNTHVEPEPEPDNSPNYGGDPSKDGPPAYPADGVFDMPTVMLPLSYDNTNTNNLPLPPSYNDVIR